MKLAFVTGANKGIGFAIVKKLAQTFGSSGQWAIYLTARNEELGRAAVNKLRDESLSVSFHQLDITDPESRKHFLEYVKANYSGINLAVNNAGIAYKHDSLVPFGEQARVTVHTNFTCTVDFTLEFLPLLANDARVVHVSSMTSLSTLKKLNDVLYSKFTSEMSLDELRKLVMEFVEFAETGDHVNHGWPSSAYGVSKLALTKASFIIGDMMKNDPRHIIMNACCPGYVDTDMTSHKGVKTVEEGADTPFYLATLPVGIEEPVNRFVSERKIVPWSKDVPVQF